MRKILQSMRALIAACLLLGGTSFAWGETYPYNVGTSTADGWFTQLSPVYSLSTNGIIDITFTNHRNDTGDTWLNWLLVCGKSTDTQVKGADNDNRYFILRADQWDDINGTTDFRNEHIFVSDNYWNDSFAEFCNGATVNLCITRVGALVTVEATMTKNSVSRKMSYFYDGVGEFENLQFYLTQNTSWLTIESEPTITSIITAQNYTNGVVDWTSANTSRYTVNMTTNGTNKYVAVNAVGNGDNGTTITGTTINGKVAAGTNFASSDNFTLLFDLYMNGGGNQPSFFHINDGSNSNGGNETVGTHLLTLYQGTAGSTSWQINGATDKTVSMSKNTWYTIQLSKYESMLYLTVKNTSTGAVVFAQQAIAVNTTKGGVGNMIFQTKRYNSGLGIDNVVLRNWATGDTPVGVPTSYTIKYRMEGDADTPIKADVLGDGLVDDVVTASSAQMTDINYNDKKYIYKTGNENITLVADAASNVITLVYREAETYTYKLSSSLGTIIANSSDFEGNTVNVGYPKYELSNHTLYEATKSIDYYRKNYTLTANVDETVTYSKTNIGNVVFYIEGEDITGASSSSENYAYSRSSNGLVGWAAGTAGENDLVITTLPAGKYKIVANVFTSSSAGGTSTFKLGTSSFAAVGNASSYNTLKESEEFTIIEDTELKLQAGGGKTNAVDFLYIIRTDVAYATIGEKGYTTFASPYALDCANLPDGLTAYYVESSNIDKTKNKVTLTPITEAVAAGTGMLLQGTASTSYDIPVVASGTDLSATNKMVGCTTETVLTSTTTNVDNFYVLVNGETAAEFQNLATYVASNNVTITAGKAYLDATGVSSARLTISFGDEATGIKTVQGEGVTVNGYYDLQGRRVAQPAKGLYIVNGKKMVIK